MKKGWEYKTIKEIGTVIGGTTPSTNNKEYWDGEHCWISPAELDGSHYLYDSVRKVTDKAVKDKNLKLLPIGTVILSSRAPIGKVTINKIPTYCNQGFKCVICGNRVYNEFLYWWFWGKTEYLNSIGTGATFKEISKKVVENIIIPVPPLSEQKEIVEYLDSSFAKIDKLKENAAKNLEEAKALFQSALKDALEPKEGWEMKTLKEVSLSITDGDHMPPPKANEGIPFVTISNIDKDSNTLSMKNTFYVPEDYYNNLKEERKPRKGDLLYTVTGSFGIPVVVDSNDRFCFQRHIAMIRPDNNKITSEFLYYWCLSPNAKMIANQVATGTAQRTVSLTSLRKFIIPIPSIKEQELLVSTLTTIEEKVNTLQQNYSRICDECDALKQAILRQVFE